MKQGTPAMDLLPPPSIASSDRPRPIRRRRRGQLDTDTDSDTLPDEWVAEQLNDGPYPRPEDTRGSARSYPWQDSSSVGPNRMPTVPTSNGFNRYLAPMAPPTRGDLNLPYNGHVVVLSEAEERVRESLGMTPAQFIESRGASRYFQNVQRNLGPGTPLPTAVGVGHGAPHHNAVPERTRRNRPQSSPALARTGPPQVNNPQRRSQPTAHFTPILGQREQPSRYGTGDTVPSYHTNPPGMFASPIPPMPSAAARRTLFEDLNRQVPDGRNPGTPDYARAAPHRW